MLNVTVKWDTTRLDRGLTMAAAFSKRTLPQVVNTAAYWVAVNAKNAMPFVTQERIDTDLGVIKTVVTVGKSGKALKKASTRTSFGRMVSVKYKGRTKQVPYAALIISARAKPGSHYNELTKGKWALDKNPFAGESPRAGRSAMKAAIMKMVKARHSATKFLLAGWVPAVRALLPFTAQKFMKGTVSLGADAKAYHGTNIGGAVVALPGTTCGAVIENAVGGFGVNAEKYNEALQKHGLPGFEAALSKEGESAMAYALKHMDADLVKECQPMFS